MVSDGGRADEQVNPMTIESIQIALPADLGDPASADPQDRPWRSGFRKRPADGPVMVTPETIVGDGVADRVNHGGSDKAILGYAVDHYAGWRELLGADAGGGGFGENLTIAGQSERDRLRRRRLRRRRRRGGAGGVAAATAVLEAGPAVAAGRPAPPGDGHRPDRVVLPRPLDRHDHRRGRRAAARPAAR